MSRNYFRVFGGLALLLTPAALATTFDGTLRLTQFLRWLILMWAIEMVGFGLVFLRKWAALYFSVPLFYFGIRVAIVSIYEIVFPLNLLAMLLGLSLSLPLVLTIRMWRQLTWGRFF